MADSNARELERRESKAFGAKQNLNSLWQELALAFYPERADFTAEICLGSEFAVDLFDSEPLRCRRDLADARSAMLRPEGQEWVKAETPDKKLNERPDIAKALDYINDRARTFLGDHDKGFIGAEKEADHDVATFGGAVKTAESDIDRNGKRVPIIRCWHLRDCAWFDDLTGVRQDVMFRRFKASARHIDKKFPGAPLHESIKNALENDPDKEFPLCHVMMPTGEYDWYKKPNRSNRKMPWASVYYDSEHKMLLRETPSQRFRYVVDRWSRIPGSQYPYSPAAMTSLPDARGIQMMAMVLLEAAEKSIDPPLKATEGAVKSDIDQRASGITWVDKQYDEKMGPSIELLHPNQSNIPIGIDLMMRTTQALRDNWYLSKLRLPQQAKTAFETQALLEEFIRANIPLFGPWQAGLSMMLEEIFAVLFDMGWFDMSGWPEELSDSDLTFSYSNPLHDAIERNRVNQGTQVLGAAAAIEKIIPGSAKTIWAFDEVGRSMTRGTGAPANWLQDEQDTKDGAASNQQGADILGALSTAQQAADVVKTGSEAASNLQALNQPAADGSGVYGPT